MLSNVTHHKLISPTGYYTLFEVHTKLGDDPETLLVNSAIDKEIELSESLKQAGWTCTVSAVYWDTEPAYQMVGCTNTSGAVVVTGVHCDLTTFSNDVSSVVLDQANDKTAYQPLALFLRCSTKSIRQTQKK